MARKLDVTQRANSAYIESVYARYLADPQSVPDEWRAFFAGFELGGREPGGAGAPVAGIAGGVFGLVLAYREFGHLIARIDPLGENPDSHALLDLGSFGLSEADLDREVDPRPFAGEFQGTLRQLIEVLRHTYCGTLGVEYMDIPDKERREWLEQRMERQRGRPALDPAERVRILESLLAADAFEQFLHVKYVGQKRFSLEGAATLEPMLETLVESAAEHGVEQLVLGMPHRGRINVLAHLMKKPLERVFGEFESSFAPPDVQGHGDVKYHLGYSSFHESRSGRTVHLDLNFNPSHLEFVNPVVLGSVRARQEYMGDLERDRGVPVLIHGDAAFVGEGIVAETLLLSQLPAYRTGGTVHIIVNNQIGFTTSPADGRPLRYATDIARVIETPVFHVNGDDPEAAVFAIRAAMDYRARFKRDVLVDLVCYRKHGHNELDDPTFTQPVMYGKIATHTPASRRYAEQLMAEGVIDRPRLEAIEVAIHERLRAAHELARSDPSAGNGPAPLGGAWRGLEWAGEDWSASTAVPEETVARLTEAITRLPKGFHAHRKIPPLLAERRKMVAEDRIDWGMGEALALGSLLLEGHRVRLSGQDTGRGTFSHRHAVLFDAEDGRRHVPLEHLAPEQGRFEIIDTPLSEVAALGFEYGYSTADPQTLVVWEAQFGDFANVAQVIIDQFLASGEAKWQRMSGLVLLLPHGYEGQGPEHSSARLERFLELCANGNMQVCNLTTPAQLFHALRRQLHRRFRKPLVIMSPKSLLRHREAVSPREAFTGGAFRTAIDDDSIDSPRTVRRVLLVSGKFYYTLLEARAAREVRDTALVRVEQLYPFPHQELERIFSRYPEVRDLRWVQEEPANMGGWRNTRHRLEMVLPARAALRLVARKASSTPATGYYQRHVEQEKTVLDRAFCDPDAKIAPAPVRVAREVS